MPLPLYVQIRETIAERIQAGEWAPGGRIPPERDLCREFGTSRMTLRQAVGDLVANGILTRFQGKGTFVAERKVAQPINPLQSFTVSMDSQGIVPGARLIDLTRIPATRDLAAMLQLRVGERVFRIVRLRTGSGQPLAVEYAHFPAQRFPGLDLFDLEKQSIYRILAEHYGRAPVRAEQTLEPAVARPFEAELLGVAVGAPLMLWERTAYAADDTPIEFARDLYRGDRIRFRVDIALPV
jgi:GntR family transcriptional regulator